MIRLSEKSRTSQPASQLFRRTGVALTSQHGSPNQPIGFELGLRRLRETPRRFTWKLGLVVYHDGRTLFRGSADENKSSLSVV
ncbi:hypothetical protein PGIGA_G00207450 [Pangasianodon gigas]|uniref:Uncharacterized protein n=1 Tax=Pangasianodon gigas TaxID=30993 RepID=A0ACC5WFF7_PANGG|nr:hypothetical protein [Pangasianodon gigas]